MTFCKRFSIDLLAFAVMLLGIFSFSIPSSALAAPSVDVQPFFLSMPQLPDGYFDGDILSNGDNYQISLDFSNLASSSTTSSSESGTLHSEGLDRYTITVPSSTLDVNGSGSWDFDGGYYYYSPVGNGDADIIPGSSQPYGSLNSGSLTVDVPSSSISVQQSADGDESYTGSSSSSGSTDYSGTVSGNITSSKDTSDHHRYRCFSSVFNNFGNPRYIWYVIDARNTIYSRFVNDGYNEYLVVYSVGGYPSARLLFGLNGSFFSTSSSFPSWLGLYPYWLSNEFPFPSNLPSSIPNGYFCDAVFGKETLLFSYLNQLHSDLNTIHSDIQSLQTSMQSAISNQTTQFMNVDSPGNFDPTDVENMLNYGTLESDFHAPSTDQIFSVSGGTFADGMTWWRDRMNETLFFSGSPITGLVTFTLTLGLAVLVIGRRVSGGGTA